MTSPTMLAPPGTRSSHLRIALEGVRDMTPMVVGVVPFALAIGSAIGASSLTHAEGLFSTTAILAGSAQMAAVHMLDTGTAGWVVVVSALVINARLLLYSASVNRFDNIHLLPLAVGDSTGYTLYRTHIGANGGLVSKEETESGDRAILHPTAQVVPLARLDNLVSVPIDVIKIDIEGAEGMAMRGAQELIRTNRPIITSEASMEMLGRVSHMTLRDYLLVTRNQNYRQFVIGRMDGRLTAGRTLIDIRCTAGDGFSVFDVVVGYGQHDA